MGVRAVVEDVALPPDSTGDPPRTRGVLGVFRRWGAGKGSAAVSFSMVEELFGPSRHQARVEVEQQRRLVRPSPSPTDPPELPEPGPVAPGRHGGRFDGIVVVRRH